MQAAKLLSPLLWLAYPLTIYFGLRVFEPRTVALLLAVALILRRRKEAHRLLSGLTRIDLATLVALLCLSALTALTNSETLLRFYPAAVNLGMLLLFGFSLRSGPSMIERFARLQEPELAQDGVRYTRRVTQIWCAFFVANGIAAAWSAVYASREQWAFYNGFLAYLLMGVLFAGEWLVRQHLRKRQAS